MSQRAATSTPPTIDLPRDMREVVDALRIGPMLLTPSQLAEIYGRSDHFWRAWARKRVKDGVGFRDGEGSHARWMIRAEAVARWIETQYAITALTPPHARERTNTP